MVRDVWTEWAGKGYHEDKVGIGKQTGLCNVVRGKGCTDRVGR